MLNNLKDNFKVWALIHATNNMEDEKIADLIEAYQRKEFGSKSNEAINITGNKLISIGLNLTRRVI